MFKFIFGVIKLILILPFLPIIFIVVRIPPVRLGVQFSFSGDKQTKKPPYLI